jgi:hypothetical protein
MAEVGPPRQPRFRGSAPRMVERSSNGGQRRGQRGGDGWWLDIFGRGPDTFGHRLRPKFPRSARFFGARGKGSQAWSLSGGSRGIRRGWRGDGCGQLGGFPSVSARFRPFPLGSSGCSGFPLFFRIGTVFRTGTSVPSGAWVEPRLPRRPPRTVCLRRRSVATSLASTSAVGDPVRLRGSGGFSGKGRRSVRSPLEDSVRPDGRRWRSHRSIRGSC